MKKYLSFNPVTKIFQDFLCMNMTNSAIDSIESCNINATKLVGVLSKNIKATLVPFFSKDSTESANGFKLFTEYGTFLCRKSDDENSFIVVSFNKNKLMDQNEALKFGCVCAFKSGLAFQFNDRRKNNFFQITKENTFKERQNYKKMSPETIKAILSLMNNINAKRGVITEEEEEPLISNEKKLDEYLNNAEAYAILADDLEQQTVNEIGKIYYSKMEATDYNRTDRAAYKFTFDFDDSDDVLVNGTSVDVENKMGDSFAAEIVESKKTKNQVIAVLLFRNQINITDFAKSGFVELSHSTVNMEVQKMAIEKIRNHQSSATYFNDVLGKSEPKGFNDYDFKKLDQELKQKKYPPNPSQMDAIKRGINSKDVFLVMGPPGTGKTTVILEWVKYFVQEKKMRVLVSSQNNKAVDNVLARIADEKEIDVLRIGSESKIQSDVQPYMFENKLRTTREDISKVTADNISKMRKGIQGWNNFIEYLDFYEKDIDLISKEMQDFNQKIQEKLVNDFEKLNRLINKNKVLKDDLNQIINEANKLKLDIEKYNNEGKIFSLLHRGDANKAKARFIELHKAFNDKERELKQDSITYKQLLNDKYFKAYIKMFKEFLIVNDQSLLPLKMKWKKLTAQFATNNYNLRLKEVMNVRNSDFLEKSILEEFKSKITTTISFYQKLLDIILEWHNLVDGTQNYALNEIVLNSVDLVGATCIGINSQRRFADLNFDVTIIDEAGQIQIHNALVPMSVSDKLIMLGDHKQIPPNAEEELVAQCEMNNIDSSLLGKSLFEEMYNNLPSANKAMLDTQFRMPAEIADILSENFYEGKYKSFEGKRNLSSILPTISKKPFLLIDTSKEKNRYEQKVDKGRFNDCEMKVVRDVISEVKRYYMVSKPDKEINELYREIGVISAYKAQVKHIQKGLNEIVPNEILSEMVASLDSFQGQERDVIIYSFTTSSKKSPEKKRIGFLKELRRLNVAMSRCKKMLILIGDFAFLSSCENDEDEIYNEKNFSIFIQNMLKSVKEKESGELISYSNFKNRLEGGNVNE